MPIRFGTYNFLNGRNGGLDLVRRWIAQANMDLGIFQENKFTDGIYTHESAGYNIVATDAPSRHRVGVAVFYRPSPHFAVGDVRQFGPNIVGFQLATGARRCYIIGCDRAPNDTSTIESVVAALKERPRGAALLVTGDLNTTLTEPDHLPLPDHAPRPPFPVPFELAREEVRCHVIDSFFRQRRRDVCSSPVIIRFRQRRVEISCHQQCGAPGPLLERSGDTFYC